MDRVACQGASPRVNTGRKVGHFHRLKSRPHLSSTQGRLCTGPGFVVSEFLVSEAVGISFQGEDFAVVDEAVDHVSGNDRIAEDLPPGGEGLVGRDDDRASFVAGGDELEEKVGGLGQPAGASSVLAAGHTGLSLVDFALLVGGAALMAVPLVRSGDVHPMASAAVAYEVLLPVGAVGYGLVT